nr:hypothetical protein [Trentepohlia sp. YN1317]
MRTRGGKDRKTEKALYGRIWPGKVLKFIKTALNLHMVGPPIFPFDGLEALALVLPSKGKVGGPNVKCWQGKALRSFLFTKKLALQKLLLRSNIYLLLFYNFYKILAYFVSILKSLYDKLPQSFVYNILVPVLEKT